MGVRLPCVDCGELATHRGRCALHHAAYEARPTVKARRKRRERLATGNDAAARLRAEIRPLGMVQCAKCPNRIFASAADIDHVIPLAHGGEDVDGNLQILCRPCHKAKTRIDFDFARPPF